MGQKLEYFGKYILLEKLATGGMAEVFLARRPGAEGIGKFLAIKRILPQFAESPEFIDMFRDEAKIAIHLSHSNIVSIHEFGVEEKQFFLVMDYVEGRNLRQILNKMKKSGSKFTADQIIYVIKEIAAGLDHAHRCLDGTTGKPLNITHRDMSPQNIMVSFEGELKIVDFGIAKAESQMETTRAGTLKGKFGYMSPEQAEGQPVDLRTDIFSLGIVLWELLGNDRLFLANNEINTLRKIRDCQVPSLKKIDPNIPAELDRITQKALARDRNLRYQTAAALHRDLNRFLNRQYPDFSPHDFSVFIKTLFSDEILSTRKRLIEYAKLPFKESASGGLPELEAPLELPPEPKQQVTQTSSFVSTSSPDHFHSTKTNAKLHDFSDEAELEMDSTQLTAANPFESVPEDSQDSLDIKSFSRNQSNLATEAATTTQNSEIEARRISASSATPEVELPVVPAVSPAASPPIPNAAAAKTPQPGVLDTGSLDALKKKIKVQSTASSQYDPDEYRFASKKPGPPIRVRRQSSWMSFVLVFVMGVTGYSLAAKYLTESMRPLISTLDPWLSPLHEVLGVSGSKELASTTKNSDNEAAELAKVPSPNTADRFGYANAEAEMIISSTPSGAEIYINGKNTQLLTPSRVMVPATSRFQLELKRSGYIDYSHDSLSREAMGMKFTATMQKALVGYVDIDVKPPKDTYIYINGSLLKGERLPINKYAVPANKKVTIRAENPFAKLSAQKTVTIEPDERVRVILELKTPSTRAPSARK